MVDLECKIEEMITHKIDDALSKRNDRRRKMVLEEDPLVLEIIVVPPLKASKSQR